MPASQTALYLAAVTYAGTAAISSVIAVRDNVPGEPLGITVPLSVPSALAVGWGAGIAPPWFMPVTALVAARRARLGGSFPATVAASIGFATIAGHLIEPVTRQPRSWTLATRTSIAMMITSPALLAAAGLARRKVVASRS